LVVTVVIATVILDAGEPWRYSFRILSYGIEHPHGNAILDTVATMTTHVLKRKGFELRAPIAVRFRTAEGGSTGVEIVVRLSDPSQCEAATAAIVDRFPDRLSEVVVR
jgi:hypothetical protein